MLLDGTSVISCSAFKMVAVMFPPSEVAPLNVTKAPEAAPWFVSVAKTLEENTAVVSECVAAVVPFDPRTQLCSTFPRTPS